MRWRFRTIIFLQIRFIVRFQLCSNLLLYTIYWCWNKLKKVCTVYEFMCYVVFLAFAISLNPVCFSDYLASSCLGIHIAISACYIRPALGIWLHCNQISSRWDHKIYRVWIRRSGRGIWWPISFTPSICIYGEFSHCSFIYYHKAIIIAASTIPLFIFCDLRILWGTWAICCYILRLDTSTIDLFYYWEMRMTVYMIVLL